MSSPRLPGRELAALAAGACLLAVGMTWPLVAHLRSEIPGGLGDPLLETWTVAWGGHALLHDPGSFFQANAFWPLRNSLAFSDALVGYAPAGLVAQLGPGAALAVYDLLFLFAYALAFAGAYLLARELGARPAAAAVAGAAFAYAPWRLAQDTHLHVLSSGGIPLSLFLLVRGYRRRSPTTVLAGWLAATWQLSLGWNLGLQFGYALGLLSVLAAVAWFWRGRPAAEPRLVAATIAGVAALVAVTGLVARPYLQILDDHPEAKRTVDVVAYFSPPPRGFLAAPADNLIWGDATRGIRDDLPAPDEQTLFPGALALALGLLGLAAPTYSGRLRAGLALAAAVTAVLSFGYAIRGASMTYGLLYEHVPGWQGLRTPGRITTLTTLAVALLAAAGAHGLLDASQRRARRSPSRAALGAPAGLAVLLLGVVLLEGYGTLGRVSVHPPPGALATAGEPVLHLPIGLEEKDAVYMYWSIDGFPRLVNGWSGFRPREYATLAEELGSFPDRETVDRLRSLGVRTVVLHGDRAPGTPWADAARRPLEKLPVTRRTDGRLVLYEIRPRRSSGG